MTLFDRWPLVAALFLVLGVMPARGGEVQADPVCCKKSCCAKKCYDPCEPVGPVRRFFRKVFLRPCPPPVAVAVVPAPACVAPPVAVIPAPPRVGMERPVPTPPISPPPSAPFPGTGSSLRRDGVLTPPTSQPPVPVRLDRIASENGEKPVIRARGAAGTPVVLVSAERPEVRKRAEADEQGRFTLELPAGTWRIYGWDAGGKTMSHGRIEVRTAGKVDVQLR